MALPRREMPVGVGFNPGGYGRKRFKGKICSGSA
jgi:hypothetical protein